MTNEIRIGAVPKCDNCGGELVTDEDNPTNDSIVKCQSCGKEFGSFGQLKSGAFRFFKGVATTSMEKSVRGVKGIKFKKR